MNETHDDARPEPDLDWNLQALHVMEQSSWLMAWFQRFTGKTSYSAIFRRMAEDISHSRLSNFSQVKRLVDLKESVRKLGGSYYTKTGQVAAFLGGHGDVPASVEELQRSIDARLLRLFTGSTLQPNEIHPDARLIARMIYDGLSNIRATRAAVHDFEVFLKARLPLNFRQDGRDFYQKFAELGFPLAQYRYGEICERAGNLKEAKRLFELAAKQGMQKAMRRLQQTAYREVASVIPERQVKTGAVELLKTLTGVENIQDALNKSAEFLGIVDPEGCAEHKTLKNCLETMQRAGTAEAQQACFIAANLFLYGPKVGKDLLKAIDYGLQSGITSLRAAENPPTTSGRISSQEGVKMLENLLAVRDGQPTPANVLQAVHVATLFDCALYLWALNDATFYEYLTKVLHPVAEAETRDAETYREILKLASKLVFNVTEPTQAELDSLIVLLSHYQRMQRPAGPAATAWRAKPH